MISKKIALFVSCALVGAGAMAQKVSDADLMATITKMDSLYFTAYNQCDMATQANLLADDIEFYHDMGGLQTSKPQLLQSIETNICGKVTRELVAGSLEVSAIPGYGAVEIGLHKFYNSEEPNALSRPSRFVTLWKNTASGWKMAKVISLHAN